MLQDKLQVFVARFNEAFVYMPGTERLNRVWARIWSLGDNSSPWPNFWGTFSFLGGQKFVHPSADAKGFVFLAGLLIGLGRKSQISRDF